MITKEEIIKAVNSKICLICNNYFDQYNSNCKKCNIFDSYHMYSTYTIDYSNNTNDDAIKIYCLDKNNNVIIKFFEKVEKPFKYNIITISNDNISLPRSIIELDNLFHMFYKIQIFK